jgi:hypothetical protein
MGCSDAGNIEERKQGGEQGESKTMTNATSVVSKRKTEG